MGWIVLLLSFSKEGFGIKYPVKIDIPLNKEAKPDPWFTGFSPAFCGIDFYVN